MGIPASRARYSRSMQTRNAARVLPDPVGAAIRVSRPAAISAHPWDWAGVGPSGKRRWNQVRTAGWSVSITRALYRPPPTPRGGPNRHRFVRSARLPGWDDHPVKRRPVGTIIVV